MAIFIHLFIQKVETWKRNCGGKKTGQYLCLHEPPRLDRLRSGHVDNFTWISACQTLPCRKSLTTESTQNHVDSALNAIQVQLISQPSLRFHLSQHQVTFPNSQLFAWSVLEFQLQHQCSFQWIERSQNGLDLSQRDLIPQFKASVPTASL